jgi:hypothetical protein
MPEELKEPFRQLARTLQSIERWADKLLESRSVSVRDRSLVDKLKQYAARCRKNSKNWTSKSAASRTRQKLDDLWASILLDVIMKPDERKR